MLFGIRFNFLFRVYYNFYRIGRCAKQGRFDRRHQAFYSRINADIIERCGGKIHVCGMEHLSGESGPFVLAGNHMSSIETILLNAIISPRMDYTFVIKQGLFSVPFLRQAMRSIEAIGVNQINPREDFKTVMEEGEKRLKSGKSVLIFPEAARCSEFDPERFNTIAVKLAKKCNVKVIPFALKTDFLTFGKILKECGPVRPEQEIRLEFGPPQEVCDNGRHTHQQILQFITERCRTWQTLKTANTIPGETL